MAKSRSVSRRQAKKLLQESATPPPQDQTTFFQVTAKQFVGLLPPPEMLAEYQELVPDLPERLLRRLESQTDHRQVLEKIAVKSGSRDSLLGLIFGLIIGLSTIGGGIYCVLQGHDISGTFLGSAGLTSLVGVFVYGTRSRRKEREEKWQSQ